MNASPALTAAYEAALPADDRVARKAMFGMPCAFVNRQMFFGTFEDSFVARVGPSRASALLGTPGISEFAPTPERPWRDYVRVEATVDAATVAQLAAEAMTWTLKLPPKAAPPAEAKKKAKKEKKKAKAPVAAPDADIGSGDDMDELD
jgi:hypothetical protein